MQQGRGRGRVRRRGSAVVAVAAVALAMGAFTWNDRRETAGGEVEPSVSSDGVTGPAVLGVSASELSSAIRARLAAVPSGVAAERWSRVQRLYADGAPLWLHADGIDAARSDALVRALLDADGDALRLDAYPIDALVEALDGARASSYLPTSADRLAAADVLLTTVYVSLAEDLLRGQVSPASTDQEWHIRRGGGGTSIDSVVAEGMRAPRLDSALAAMRPHGPAYEALRAALERYRALAAAGGWPTVPTGRMLHPGQHDDPARLAALRERLGAEGYGVDQAVGHPADGATGRASLYDRALAGLVAEYQARHGIVVDSVLGDETVQSMNVPAAYRLGQIAANLERIRWMPRALGERYVMVNVPAFRLEAHDPSGSLEMKVIVGKGGDDKTTPVFSDSMEAVVFRPYWNITPEIQATETAPRIADDPGYLAANDLEYYHEAGRTRIRQRPGPHNALGLVKFLFPNDYNVYLHDTPNEELFDRDVRAFSHGCIRLEKPAELAEWVLGWDSARVYEAMQAGGDNRWVKVPHPAPVYITYFTAYARDGVLNFGNDLYGRDAALVRAVSPGAEPGAETASRVEALRRLVGE